MRLAFGVVNWVVKRLTHVLCRIDASQLERVPTKGPLIVVANHINFLEVPVLFTHLQPRPVTGFAKAENWDKLFTRMLFTFWGAIPLRRGEADVEAIRKALAALKQGWIVAVAPEGTRSGHGRLQPGHPGVAMLALRSGVPLLPIAYYGAESYRQDYARLRRADFNIRVGQPFQLDAKGLRATREMRQQITDEIMYQIAALLPSPYRGHYSDLKAATETYLQFSPGVQSNLALA